MNEGRLRGLLGEQAGRFRLTVLDSAGSTNDELRRLAAGGAPAGSVVIAGSQSAGRGRLGRRWHSPPGSGLYLSVLFRPEAPPAESPRWTLGAAVAACRACREISGLPVEIKWPNDLLVRGAKIAGVLAELRTPAGRPAELVIGVGINVLQREGEFPAELAGRATSLALATGRDDLDREGLAAALLVELARVTGRLDRGEWDLVASEWEELAPSAYDGRVRVTARAGESPFEGRTAGLAPDGALRVRRADGRVEAVRVAGSVIPVES